MLFGNMEMENKGIQQIDSQLLLKPPSTKIKVTYCIRSDKVELDFYGQMMKFSFNNHFNLEVNYVEEQSNSKISKIKLKLEGCPKEMLISLHQKLSITPDILFQSSKENYTKLVVLSMNSQAISLFNRGLLQGKKIENVKLQDLLSIKNSKVSAVFDLSNYSIMKVVQ